MSGSQFDNFGAVRPAPASSEKVLYTAKAIGGRIGVSEDFVRDVLAKQEGTPVRKIGGKYFAVESELVDFFRPKAHSQS